MDPGNPAIRRSRTTELVPDGRVPGEPEGFDEALMETKLHPPAIRDGLVERPDLDALLEAAPVARVTVVSAPTGYGKTTLLSSWARRRSDPVAWLTVEAADNDPVRFLQHLVGSFERAGSIPRPPRPRSPVAPGIDVLATVIARLLNQLGARTESVVLIVDDYQALSDARCHALMQSLIEGSPTTLRFVIATRADPALPLGRWRAQGNLHEIRQADLRFGTDEAGRFLNGVLGLALDEADVVALDERAEGWPAGLYLAAMSLRGQADRAGFIRRFAGSNRHLVDYLGPEVLGPVDHDTRTFLLHTAWLERLTGPLCDAVIDADDSADRLRQLYRDNLFLTALDDDGVWYRYHRLFAELLRSILASETPTSCRSCTGVRRPGTVRTAGWNRACDTSSGPDATRKPVWPSRGAGGSSPRPASSRLCMP